MSQPHISKQNSWQKHEKRVIESIILALVILRSEEGLARLKDEFKLDDHRSIEDRINRTLFFCLNKANRKLLASKRGVKSGVIYETRNQPDPQLDLQIKK